ncbi:MAG TPA: hypothetical protein VKP88_04170 [Candidatus Paceibacterota bacterium]|nr:hypothetical protein [Candidatus Paceibacterota bacterium]
MFNTLKTIIPLALVCTVLVGYTYIDAQWVGPSTSPTGGNAPAPINVGNNIQTKTGPLGVGGLGVYGSAEIVAPNPQLDLIDTTPGDERGWSFRADAGELRLIRTDDAGTQIGDPVFIAAEHSASDPADVSVKFDRDVDLNNFLTVREGIRLIDDSPQISFREEGVASNNWRYKMILNDELFSIYANRDDNASGILEPIDGGPLFRLFASSTLTPGQDFAYFGSQVRAAEYCDQVGSNCVNASDMTNVVNASPLPTGCDDGDTLAYDAGTNAWECASGGGGTTGQYQCPARVTSCPNSCVGQISNNPTCTTGGVECTGGCSGDNPDYGCVASVLSCTPI